MPFFACSRWFRHLSAGLLFAAAPLFAGAQAFWGNYGGNAQHTAASPVATQTMQRIRWRAPVDLYPPYSGTDLLIHYSAPLISQAGTVAFAVRTGPNSTFPTTNDTFRYEGHNPQTGTTTWTQSIDYTTPPHNYYSWTPACDGAIGPNGKLYMPGAGGTILVRSNTDSPTATLTRLVFYGTQNYYADPQTYNKSLFITSPITCDKAGNLYFTYGSFAANPLNIIDGIARISPDGTASYVDAVSATGITDTNREHFALSCAPAVSNDGSIVYVAARHSVNASGWRDSYLVALDTNTLSTLSKVHLFVPVQPQSIPAGATATSVQFEGIVHEDGTSSPMVGPDDDVYYGVWYSNVYRGFMMHFDKTLTVSKPAGAFGWDDTASVVPRACVPSYSGTSSYLILTKYNNYADGGAGDGLNHVGVLDPNATETYVSSGNTYYTTMREVILLLGLTPNTDLPGYREWCINTSAIDTFTKSAIVNSEDGHVYRWDFTLNKAVENNYLAPPTGEAYTSTTVGKDGMCFAINNATLFALTDNVKATALAFSAGSTEGGNTATAHITLSAPATGPGAIFSLTSTNPAIMPPSTITVPRGATSLTFQVPTKATDAQVSGTITAVRYDSTVTTGSITLTPCALSGFTVSSSSLIAGQTVTGTLHLTVAAPTSGRTISVSASSSAVSVPGSSTVPSGATSTTFAIKGAAVASDQTVTVTAKSTTVSFSQTLTVHAAALSGFTVKPTAIVGGFPVSGTIAMTGTPPASGAAITVTYGLNTKGSPTVYATTNPFSFNIGSNTVSVTSSTSVTVAFRGISKTASLTLKPYPVLSALSVVPSNILMTYVGQGTATLDSAAPPGGVNVTLSAPSTAPFTFTSLVAVAAGATVGHFTLTPKILDAAATALLTGSYRGTKTMSVTVTPVIVSALTFSPNPVVGGNSVTATLSVNHHVGAALIIHLSASSANATPPATVTIPATLNQVTFQITTKSVAANTTVSIYATAATATSRFTSTLNLTP